MPRPNRTTAGAFLFSATPRTSAPATEFDVWQGQSKVGRAVTTDCRPPGTSHHVVGMARPAKSRVALRRLGGFRLGFRLAAYLLEDYAISRRIERD